MIYDSDERGPYVCGRGGPDPRERFRKYYYNPDKLKSRERAKKKAARDAGEVFNPSSEARKAEVSCR